MARKKQQEPWQYKVSFGLTLVLLLLIFGYFAQSFKAVREIQPVRIAVERLRDAPVAPETDSEAPPGNETEDTGKDAQ
jgi:hypothetical protein